MSAVPCRAAAFAGSVAQQVENGRGQLVRLRDHRRAGLLQDLRARQVGGLGGEVGVHDPGTRRRLVLAGDRQVRDRHAEAAHRRAVRGPVGRDHVELEVDLGERGRGGSGSRQAADDRGDLRGRDRERVAVVGADLEHLRAGVGTNDRLAVELRLRRDAVISPRELLVFGVEVGAVAGPVRAVLRLHGELAHALQGVGDGRQRAFGGLGERDAVVGVADRDVGAADLRVHAVGDRQARGVVLRGIDSEARRQPLHRRRERALRRVQAALRVERDDVGVDRLRHGGSPCGRTGPRRRPGSQRRWVRPVPSFFDRAGRRHRAKRDRLRCQIRAANEKAAPWGGSKDDAESRRDVSAGGSAPAAAVGSPARPSRCRPAAGSGHATGSRSRRRSRRP